MATNKEAYAMPDWAMFSGHATLSADGVVEVGGPGLTARLLSNVTAPVRAKARPSSAAPVAIVTDAWARMVPLKIEFVPRVAELPTCQKMLHALAPLIRMMFPPAPPLAVVVSEEATWKMKGLRGTLCASSVRFPELMLRDDVDL